jgi:hypothetical protein
LARITHRHDILDFWKRGFVILTLIQVQQLLAQGDQTVRLDISADAQIAPARSMAKQLLVSIADLASEAAQDRAVAV